MNHSQLIYVLKIADIHERTEGMIDPTVVNSYRRRPVIVREYFTVTEVPMTFSVPNNFSTPWSLPVSLLFLIHFFLLSTLKVIREKIVRLYLILYEVIAQEIFLL